MTGSPTPRRVRVTPLYEVCEVDADTHEKRLIAGGPSDAARLIEETSLGLEHPAILQVVHPRGARYEAFEGPDLVTLLERSTRAGVRLSPATVLALLHELARALAYAQALGVRHGFIGLHSVLVSPDGVVKLTDFRLGAVPGQAETDDAVAVGALASRVCEALEPLDREGLRARAAAGQLDLGARILAPDLAAIVEGLSSRRLRSGRALGEAVARALAERGVSDVHAVLARWVRAVAPLASAPSDTFTRPTPRGDDGPALIADDAEERVDSLLAYVPTRVVTDAEPSTRPELSESIGLAGTVLDGRYQIIEELAVGGMGRLYRATQLAVGREVVIKTVRADLEVGPGESPLGRFENEARLISQLRHPNTLRLYDFGQVHGELYLVTELLHGETIEERLRDGPIEPRTVVRWLIDLADALHEAHGKGIVHRDIKPRNLFLDRVGDRELIKILDFGLAKLSGNAGYTAVGLVVGSPAYMSPEQGGAGDVGPASDLYSLGVTAFEMLTARAPFEATQPHALMLQHRYDPPPAMASLDPPVEVPAELEAIVRELLAKDPRARPASAAALRDRLTALELGSASSSSGGSSHPRAGGDDAERLVGTVLHNFRIVELLGSGAGSRVYAGQHEILGREVAIKVLTDAGMRHESAQKRLRREAVILARIAHPAVVAVLDCGVTSEGAPYLVLERIHGRTLRQVLETDGQMPVARVVHLARQIAAALGAAHAQGVVHRDLKPSNVMVVEGDVVKVVDFGIARLADAEEEGTKLTRNKALLGSPSFMAPEQIEAPSTAGPAADLYALGCTLYVMLTGHAPFRGSVGWVLEQQRSAEVPALPPIGGLEKVVAKLLRKRPEDRPASAAAVVAMLDMVEVGPAVEVVEPTRILGAQPGQGAQVSVTHPVAVPFPAAVPADRARPGPGRGWIAGGVASVALGLALAVGWMAGRRAPSAEDAPGVERGVVGASPAVVGASPGAVGASPGAVGASPAAEAAASPSAAAESPGAVRAASPGAVAAASPGAVAAASPGAVAAASPSPAASPSVAASPAVVVANPSPASASRPPRTGAPTATPEPALRARLASALASRGLAPTDLPPPHAALLTTARTALDAHQLDAATAAIARLELALASLPLDTALVKAKLDRIGRTLTQRAPRLPEPTVRALEDRYLALAVRLTGSTSTSQLQAILRDAAQLERDLVTD